MKKKLLFLVATMLFVPNVLAAELTAGDDAELINAFANANDGDTIKLTANIDKHEGAALKVSGGKKLTLDLNGHNLTTEPTMTKDSNGNIVPVNKSIVIDNGTLTITGTGTITHEGHVAVNVWASETATDSDYSTLIVEKNVTLKGKTGISVFYGTRTNSWGGRVTLNGKVEATENGVTVNGFIKETSNRPIINIKNGANVTAKGTDGVALYGAGNAVWNIEDGTIINGEGTAIGAKSGKFNINGGKFTTTGKYVADPELYNNGINPSGSTIQIETNPANYYGNVEMYINGGEFESENGNSIFEYGSDTVTAVSTIEIDGAIFTNPEGVDAIKISKALNDLQKDENSANPISIKTASFTNDVSNDFLGEDTVSIKFTGLFSDTKEMQVITTLIVPKGTELGDEEIEELNNVIGTEENGYKFTGYYLDSELKNKADLTEAFDNNATIYMGFTKIENKGNEENPKTGDMNLALVLAILGAASIGTVYTSRKRLLKSSR